MQLAYKVYGMDCTEEVAILKRELIPIVGDEDLLEFDTLQGKLNVKLPGNPELNKSIIDAIFKTGMRPQNWIEFCEDGVCAIEESFWRKKGRVILSLISGLIILTAFIIQVFQVGFASALHGNYTDSFTIRSLYLLATVSGAWFILPKAWYSLRKFRPDMNLLMILAVTGAIVIGELVEAAVVSFLFAFSLLLESWSVNRARRAIQSLMELSPEIAHILDDDGVVTDISAKDARIGTRLIVRPHERVPADGLVSKGISFVNQAPITGESLEIEKSLDDFVYAGSLNGDGTLEIVVQKDFSDTSLSNIIKLVEENQAHRSPSEKWVDRFARIYTPVMMVIAFLVAVIPPLLFGEPWSEWFYEALVILVIACPCALVISTPVSVVSGLASAARNGVLIKGGSFLEVPSKIRAFAFDKTGTLTHGTTTVQTIIPLNGHDEDELLTIASALEVDSSHPLAKAILARAEEKGLPIAPADDHLALRGRGVKGKINNQMYWLGSHRLLEESTIEHADIHKMAIEIERSGQSVIAVFNEEHVCGLMGISDVIRKESMGTIQDMKKLGIKYTCMLTGDNTKTAESIAQHVSVDEVHAELLPEDKAIKVQELKRRFGSVAIVGDGINDAPAMAASDLGIAMGAIGTDAAIETADIALMSDDLSKITWLIGHSKRTMTIIKQNIIFALGIKLVFVFAALFQVATLWMAIAADMGASLLVIFNGLRLLKK
jgi:Cd2+/Zn2+-exporting ATPase